MPPVSSYLTRNQFVRENLATCYRRYFIMDPVITFTMAGLQTLLQWGIGGYYLVECKHISGIYYKYLWLRLGLTFPPRQGETTESADDSNIEPEIVPPSGVLGFIDPDIRIKNAPYQ